MNIKITFKYDKGILEISSEALNYNETVPSVVCLEQNVMRKSYIYSIGIGKEMVLKQDNIDSKKFVFIDPFCMETFDDKLIRLVIKYYCSVIHGKKFPKWWQLRFFYGIDRYSIHFFLPYNDLFLERVKKQLLKISNKKYITVSTY